MVDEFAALVGEVPEFVDGVVDVAQRGRSLGLHLILATQRPAGVIKDNLRANTNLRIALRMADEHDSKDVLGDEHGGALPAVDPRPRRREDRSRPAHHVPVRLCRRVDHRRSRSAPRSMSRRWTSAPADAGSCPPPRSVDEQDPGPNDIARVVATIRRAASEAGVPAPRKPWLEELAADATTWPACSTGARTPSLLLGVLDNPPQQAQAAAALRARTPTATSRSTAPVAPARSRRCAPSRCPRA